MPKKLFDPSIHCGAPRLDEPVEALQKKLDRAKLAFIKGGPKTQKRMAPQIKALETKIANPAEPMYCRSRKGTGTNHQGSGLCRIHCSCKGAPDGHLHRPGPFESIRNQKLRDAMQAIKTEDKDLLDLTEELTMFKALVLLRVNAGKDGEELTPLDLQDISILLERSTKLVERINSIRIKNMVTKEAVNGIIGAMGKVLVDHAKQFDGKVFDWKLFTDSVKSGWGTIEFDPNSRALTS